MLSERSRDEREILFRGKGNRGKWVEGFYTPISTGHDGMKDAIITGTDRNCFIPVIVIPENIGQYTGLTDKNGVKIFEGDIVRYNGEKHIVVFETRGETGYFGIKIDHIETWGFCLSVPAKLMEVIGNIHDNPELAEGLL